MSVLVVSVVFFFQAEDGIRDRLVTGVQTCALPILRICYEQKIKSLKTTTYRYGTIEWE